MGYCQINGYEWYNVNIYVYILTCFTTTYRDDKCNNTKKRLLNFNMISKKYQSWYAALQII